MSKYYNPNRKKNIFDPKSKKPFLLSRSKIDLFLNCPRCFYLDCRLGIAQPSGFPFSLNAAVDTLLKKEFDIHRAKSTPHPLMKTYKIEAVPYSHEMINVWRNAKKGGIKYHHKETNLVVYGAVDDIWINDKNQLIIVDYKATSKSSEVNIDANWQIGYKRQMEIYQWLFRKNNFEVSDIGYFVYCNGNTNKEAFDGKLEFNVKIIPYQGNCDWVENTLKEIKGCLMNGELPFSNKNCDFCQYRQAAFQFEVKQNRQSQKMKKSNTKSKYSHQPKLIY